ncbi:MAG: MFS transporter [Dehalococcoidia bacterium]
MAEQALTVGRRQGLFYGWWIVFLGFANNFCAAGFGGYAFSVLLKSMADDANLGWSRTEIVLGMTLSAIVGTAAGPFLGPLVDRKHGARLIMAFAGITGGLGIALVSQVDHLWQYYLLFGVLTALVMNITISLVVPTVVSKWFIRQRGRALILSTMGRPLSGILLLPLTQVLVSSVGWRTTWLIFGIAVAAILLPANGLLMRRSPEDVGLRPDGDDPKRPIHEVAQPASESREVSWTLISAMRAPQFWLVLMATNLGMAGLAGVLINQVAYLKENFSDSVAVAGATLVTVVSLTSRALWLMIVDRVDPRYSVAGAFAVAGLGMVFLINATTIPLMVLWAIAFGMGIAGMDPLTSQLFASYFGRTFLGSIRGVVALTTGIAFAGAPLLTAFIADATDDYRIAFLVFLIGFSIATLLILFARRPQPRRGKLTPAL